MSLSDTDRNWLDAKKKTSAKSAGRTGRNPSVRVMSRMRRYDNVPHGNHSCRNKPPAMASFLEVVPKVRHSHRGRNARSIHCPAAMKGIRDEVAFPGAQACLSEFGREDRRTEHQPIHSPVPSVFDMRISFEVKTGCGRWGSRVPVQPMPCRGRWVIPG